MEKGENNINVTPIFGGETRNTEILIIIILEIGQWTFNEFQTRSQRSESVPRSSYSVPKSSLGVIPKSILMVK